MLQGCNTTIKLDANHVSNELKDDSKLVPRILGETKILNDMSAFKTQSCTFLATKQRYLPVNTTTWMQTPTQTFNGTDVQIPS